MKPLVSGNAEIEAAPMMQHTAVTGITDRAPELRLCGAGTVQDGAHAHEQSVYRM